MAPTKVLALSGGVGGAKLALGLSRILPPGALTVVANVGDDFEHLGLSISPDLDTLMYVLAGLNDVERGWGRSGETWTFMNAIAELGGDTWFQLGDGDLATHVERTRRLRQGVTLSAVTADFCSRLKITTEILPATDDNLRTIVHTAEGVMPFQEYFVRRQCAPQLFEVRFEGASTAKPHPRFVAELENPDLQAIVICPSNPFVSIDPILSLSGVREALCASHAPVVAVSPIIGGRAVKGPAAKMLHELGLKVTAASVAGHYGSIIDGFVLDQMDAALASDIAVKTCLGQTLMNTIEDRVSLAQLVLDFAQTIAQQ